MRSLSLRPFAAPLAAAFALLLSSAATRGAAGARVEVARLVPAGAVAVLESDDLGGLLDAWRSSSLRAGFEGTSAEADMQHGMLYQRLGDRLGVLEKLAGFHLDVDRLRVILGRQAALAVYDLGETRFVLIAQLADRDLRKTPFAGAAKRFPRRSYAGLDYFVDGDKDAQLLFAVVGDRLVVGNDPDHVRAALVLAARATGTKYDGKTATPAALADDADYARLLAASPAAAARVYVHLDAIRDLHHFKDFWIFDWAGRTDQYNALDDVHASLLSLSLVDGQLVETRVHVADAAATDGLPEGKPGHADDRALCQALPPGLVVTVGAQTLAASDAVERLLPRRGPAITQSDDDADAHDRDGTDVLDSDLAAALQAAGAGRTLEVVTVDEPPAAAGVPLLRRGGAVAVRLATPAKLDERAVEKAVVAALRLRVGPFVPLAFADAPGGGLRTLTLPLVDPAEWQLAIVPPTAAAPYLVIAVDPAAARALADALGHGAAALLDPAAPRCQRIDVAGLAARWHALADALTARKGFASDDEARFATDVVPGLFAAMHLTNVTTVTYRSGDLLIEEAHVRW
jgi:hypothetical protein